VLHDQHHVEELVAVRHAIYHQPDFISNIGNLLSLQNTADLISLTQNRLATGIKLANKSIFDKASSDMKYKGMGTTIVSTLVSGDKIYVGHVGDSRVYCVRDGSIKQLTRDHSLLEDYKDAKPDMTEEEERNFPHKNVITRALGMRETVQVDIRSHQIKSGDVYVLCSDGLSGMVIDDQICQIATNAKSLERAVAELVDAANRNGGTDNVTTLLLQCLAA